MTVKTDASSTWTTWSAINWQAVEIQVKQLQMRIAKAIREGNRRKAQSLQWLLTHSYYAKLLAIRRVTQNKGRNTAGIDGIVWRTPNQKLSAVKQLKRKGYQPLPLKRIYIPKKNGKLRPLSIPPMRCRAMQALHLLALEPIAETMADKNAYGFRPKRSCADAIGQCFIALAKKVSGTWILEGDIKSCFDKIGHPWLLDNILMDKLILSKWLKAGYIEQGKLYPTNEGTPQGSIISPTLLTLTLAGLEDAILASVNQYRDRVHIATYADDFIITGKTREILEETVQPIVEQFLKERGLELSEEKTLITHIDNGFNFLGFNVRKYKGKLLIKPARDNVTAFLNNIREIVKSRDSIKTEDLINLLNAKIIGWANYYKHVVSKAIFSKVDSQIFSIIWRWAKRRHPNKSKSWIQSKYFCRLGNANWVFNAGMVYHQGRYKLLHLIRANSIAIVRHIKIRAEANPYDPKHNEYFEKRRLRNKSKYMEVQCI